MFDILKNNFQKFRYDFSMISRHVYILIIIHFLVSFSEFSLALNLYVYTTFNFNATDNENSVYFTIWMIIKKILILPIGLMIDKVTIDNKKIMWICLLILCVSFALLGVVENLSIILILVFIPITISSIFLESILHINIGRYNIKDETGKSISFSLMYLAMNLGSIVSSFTISYLKDLNENFNKYQLLFVICGLSYFIAFTFSFFYVSPPIYFNVDDRVELKYIIKLFKDKQFIKLIKIIFLISFVQSSYRYFELLFPKLFMRQFDDNNYKYALKIAINEFGILILVPIAIIILRRKKNIYDLLIFGTLISAISVLIIISKPILTEINLILFFIVFTIGEAIYSPKIKQLTFNCSKESNRGIVGAVVPIINSFSSVIVALTTSFLLNNYCPAEGYNAYSCNKVWTILFSIFMITPLGLIIFEKILNKKN